MHPFWVTGTSAIRKVSVFTHCGTLIKTLVEVSDFRSAEINHICMYVRTYACMYVCVCVYRTAIDAEWGETSWLVTQISGLQTVESQRQSATHFKVLCGNYWLLRRFLIKPLHTTVLCPTIVYKSSSLTTARQQAVYVIDLQKHA